MSTVPFPEPVMRMAGIAAKATPTTKTMIPITVKTIGVMFLLLRAGAALAKGYSLVLLAASFAYKRIP